MSFPFHDCPDPRGAGPNDGFPTLFDACSHPRWGFEEAAMAAVHVWEFTPGKYKDQPSDVLMTLKIDFRLNQ